VAMPVPPPWCDGRWRCTVCPGGLGEGGRGYARFRNVGCRDPEGHIINIQPMPNQLIHVCRRACSCDIYPRRPIVRDSEPRSAPFQICSAQYATIQTPTAWCSACTREIDAVPNHPNAAPPPPNAARVLDRHIKPLPANAATRARKRRRESQLLWCDRKYRCVHCFPKGQTRPLSISRCSDQRAHMPFGIAGEEVVHLAAPYGGLFQIPDDAKATLRDLVASCECGQCRSMLRTCELQVAIAQRGHAADGGVASS
jgi:hypothetical protein